MKRTLATCLAAALAASAVMAAVVAAAYRGNIETKVFHGSSCEYFNCKNCTVEFNTREHAIKAGYSACKFCKP